MLSSPVGDVLSLHTGKVLHSHEYSFAEPFSGQSVVVLGAHASGLDISIELARVGAQVGAGDSFNSRNTASGHWATLEAGLVGAVASGRNDTAFYRLANTRVSCINTFYSASSLSR